MHNEVRQQLCQLIAQYGRSLSEDPRRCQALLKDYCGQHKREIFVLISALKNRVAEDLLKAPVGIPQSIVLARLNKRLEDELGFTEEAARWAVEAWAFALEILEQPLPVNQPVTTPPTNQPAPTPSSEPSPEIIEGFGIITPPATASSPRLSALPLAPAAKPVATPPPATTPITVASPPLPLTQSMANRYRDNGDGTVTDKQTGLQWIRFSLGQTWISGACIGNANGYQWQGAIDKVNMLNRQGGYAGYRDWRLPTKEELLTLIYCTSGQPHIWNDTGNPCQGNYKTPTIDQIAFPNTPSFSWSSSISVNKDYAWCVRFDNGCVSDYSKRLYFNIRLVRGKSSATIIPPKKPVTPNINHSNSTIYKPKKEGYILNILVFLVLNPKIAFGLALIVYMIFFIGYKMISNTIVNHRLNSYISDKANEQIKSPYHNNRDGTVIDSRTNLQWMRCSFGQVWQENSCTDQSQSYTWPEAIYATKLLNRQGGYSGFTDWRLPTKEELLTLVYCSSSQPKLWNETGNSCQGNYEKPTIHQKTFPNNPAKWFWSSSTNEEGSVWDIYFVEGNAAVHQKTTVGSFRLVRNYQIPSIATSNESNFLSEPIFEKAKAGDSDAQFKVGLMYANGQGVSKNDIEAVRWYRLAAGQGNAKAQNRLGRLYDDGESVPKDTIEAVKWYRLAADQGYSVAQYNLGRMYEEGQGIPKNIEEATKWYHLATVQGDADAKKRLATITLTDRYLDHGDGTVTDVQTHLQWMRCSLGQEWKGNTCVGNNQKYTWQLAINAADTLNHQGGYAGFSDWRLPIKEELLTLVY